MFKKIYSKIDSLSQLAINNLMELQSEHYKTRDEIHQESCNIISKMDAMSKTIVSQQHTIEQLTNALKDKYEHGLFVFSEDCKTPVVIRNGKEVITDRNISFRLTWTAGEAPLIETEQLVGTFSGEDE